ncbi:DivIVA domain-containing protein [Hymenobacter sp. BT507]|uniref:DivIVA domain-containing protein n=1 Tax=Hymenobacter citatus TaxID=2763506 RepID=A0ABR7MHT8_9BACT|nr:DivIVA domain-containing protein [Hymenobacter citatus]MBC6610666.1 DivIVA domain-containing protein [Hymenobacter citatus]
MKISALDIRQKTFEKAFRGLDADEVNAFLLTLSQQWERMGDENRDLRNKLDYATQEVQKMREIESSLYRTLKTAEDTGQNITEQAQRNAEIRLREAQLQAEELLSQARQKARTLVEDAYKQAERSVTEMQVEVSRLNQEHQRLEGVLDSLVRDLQHLATDTMEKADKARNRPKGGTAAILSRAASVKVSKPEPSPEATPAMHINTAATSSAAAVGGALVATQFGSEAATSARPIGPQPGAYNPKPGQQPDPGAPAQIPGPEISPDPTPNENPGQVPPSRIDEPAPSRIIEPDSPNVEPVRPDIQPVGPSHPEIVPPAPAPQPGTGSPGPGFKTEPAVAEKSFFDEI